MKKVDNSIKAIKIFYDYERMENRLPTKQEFDLAYYGRILERGESNWYYKVKRNFIEETGWSETNDR